MSAKNTEWIRRRRQLAEEMRARGLHDLADKTNAETDGIAAKIMRANDELSAAARDFDTKLPADVSEDTAVDLLWELDAMAVVHAEAIGHFLLTR